MDDGVYNLTTGAKTSNTPDGNCDYFYADLLSATDYYAFGAAMPGRQFNNGNYRYGFNGKENDNELKGTGNEQDYGMRIYDPRLGRFLSVDPLEREYPWNSSYAFCENRVIDGVDLDGGEFLSYIFKQTKTGVVLVSKTDYTKTKEGVGSEGPGVKIILVDKKGDIHKQFLKPAQASLWTRFISKLRQKDREWEGHTEPDSNPNLPDNTTTKPGQAPEVFSEDKPYEDKLDPRAKDKLPNATPFTPSNNDNNTSSKSDATPQKKKGTDSNEYRYPSKFDQNGKALEYRVIKINKEDEQIIDGKDFKGSTHFEKTR